MKNERSHHFLRLIFQLREFLSQIVLTARKHHTLEFFFVLFDHYYYCLLFADFKPLKLDM